MLKPLCLITAKPAMFVGNVAEDGFENNPLPRPAARVRGKQKARRWWRICAKIEAELADMDDEDKQMFLAEMGQDEPGLNRLIRAAFKLLGLQTYFTAGVKEVRAWTIHVGDTAPQAAGVIHTDFETRLHPRPDHRLRRLHRLQGRAGREGRRQDARRRQGVRGQGRRRAELPVQRLSVAGPDGRLSSRCRQLVPPRLSAAGPPRRRRGVAGDRRRPQHAGGGADRLGQDADRLHGRDRRAGAPGPASRKDCPTRPWSSTSRRLKALSNDIRLNLEAPLAGIRAGTGAAWRCPTWRSAPRCAPATRRSANAP